MLSAEKNKVLTQVGPGTPMGDYLRRYWMPIGGASELDANPIKTIRLMGEDLVLYKDLGGRYGLVDRHCPHRRADLSYGMVGETGFREVVISDIPCNWFQCQENSCDPVHFEWMHENWNTRLNGAAAPYSAKHLKLVFEEFDYGYVYKRVREGQREGDPVWTIGRVALWPNGFYLGNHFEWRVPIDDENTLSVCWFFMRVPKGREPYVQAKVPTWISPIKDENGRWISSHVINQDIIAWVGQGTIADRTKETLGASDLGIAMMRKRFFDELDAVAKGAEPKAVF